MDVLSQPSPEIVPGTADDAAATGASRRPRQGNRKPGRASARKQTEPDTTSDASSPEVPGPEVPGPEAPGPADPEPAAPAKSKPARGASARGRTAASRQTAGVSPQSPLHTPDAPPLAVVDAPDRPLPVVRPEAPVPAIMPDKTLALVQDPPSEADGPPARRRRRRGGRGRKRPDPAMAASQEQSGLQVPESGAPDAPVSAAGGGSDREPDVGPEPASASASKSDPQPAPQSEAAPPGASIPLTADSPALLLEAGASVLAQVPVMDETGVPRSGRSRRRGGRGRGDAQPLQAATAATPVPQVQPAKAEPKAAGKGRKLLVSVLPEEQVEVVILENGKVREYYIEMTNQVKIRGNIYKGVISNIDTNLQAAFVNYGAVKNGFLQIDEVHPEYYLNPAGTAKGHKFPPIQKVLKAGQEVLVQVGKEPTGNKGAFLTTWVSLAGRFLVLTPGQDQIGISRKVEDGEERNRLRELIKGLEPGEGLGAIVRTVSAGITKTTMQKDLNFLKRLWRDIRKKGQQEKAPALVYQEPGLAARAVRDYLTDDVTEIWVDDETTAAAMRDMVNLLFPRKPDLIKTHTDTRRTLLERFDALPQIEQIHAREVHLPSGGRLVFDQTEALMAIDINSGKSGGNKNNFEGMAFRTNLEAAEVIPQQLRLRDIGGQVVIDFIEMRDPHQTREVEKTLRAGMKVDRARHDIGAISAFGLMQIVRQRTGSSAISISMEACPFCQGTGTRRNMEWQAVQALRDLARKMRDTHDSGQTGLVYIVDPELAWYLLNHKRDHVSRLEKDLGVSLEIRPGRTP